MTTLTLSPDPDYGRMRVVVQGATGGQLVRDGQPVRPGGALSGDAVVDDYECPFGVPVTYWMVGEPGGTADEPVDVAGQPPTSSKWSTFWSAYDPTWLADGVTLTHAREGEGVLLSGIVVPVTPGQRYRFTVQGTGLVVTPATATLFDVQLATDQTPDFFDPQSVGVRSPAVPVPLGAHAHLWELTIPASIVPSAGAGAPQSMRLAVRLRPSALGGETVKVSTITVTRLAVPAEQVTGILEADSPWLSHPTRPDLSLPVTVRDDDDWEWSAPGEAMQPLGGSLPLWVHSARSSHEGVLELLDTWQRRQAMAELLADGSALLLRTPPGCYVDDAWVAVLRAVRRKSRPAGDDLVVHWLLAYQRVARPGGYTVGDPSNAWDAVVATHDTWQALIDAHPSWVDVLLTYHPHQTTAAP